MTSRRAAIAAAAALAVLAGAAVASGDVTARANHTVTAIDYHFHDAHPSPPLELGSTLRVVNQGSALHNVSFPDAGYSEDLEPGEEIVIERLDELFDAPGRYSLVCAYHADFGMTGVIVIVG